jgi:hypothetical protein
MYMSNTPPAHASSPGCKGKERKGVDGRVYKSKRVLRRTKYGYVQYWRWVLKPGQMYAPNVAKPKRTAPLVIGNPRLLRTYRKNTRRALKPTYYYLSYDSSSSSSSSDSSDSDYY